MRGIQWHQWGGVPPWTSNGDLRRIAHNQTRATLHGATPLPNGRKPGHALRHKTQGGVQEAPPVREQCRRKQSPAGAP
eukprot:2100406-Karenia_brevis.AAC.1